LIWDLQDRTADAFVEQQLLKAAVASSAARVRGRKRLGVSNNGKRLRLWLNQVAKDVIEGNKVACKA